jgi:hypothetical protein
MILPIGQYLGATADGAHEVRRGDETELADQVERLVGPGPAHRGPATGSPLPELRKD